MKLTEAYRLIITYDEAQYIHIDHICEEPSTHNLKYCPLPLWSILTEDDMELETELTLKTKLEQRYNNL